MTATLGVILLLVFFIIIFSGMSVGIGLLLFGIIYMMIAGDIPIIIVAQRMIAGVDSQALLVLPFFLMTAEIMNNGGVTKRLVGFADAAIGWLPGGLGLVVMASSMMFAAMTGSAIATVVTIGTMLLPSMLEAGYSKVFAASIIAAASIMGPIIPPSAAMVLYGITANVSVGKLLASGILPGIIMGLALMAYIILVAKKKNLPRSERKGRKELFASFIRALPSLFLPIILFSCIYGGVATVTEAAVISVFYSLGLNLFVYKEFSLSKLPELIYKAGKASSGIFLIIAGGSVVSWIVTREQLPQTIVHFFVSISSNPTVVFFSLCVFLLILGCFMDNIPAIIILAPIFTQLALELGYDPVHFGAVVVYTLLLGLITPPIGMVLFVTSDIAQIDTALLAKDIFPFLVLFILIGVALILIPSITLFVPNLLIGN